MERERKLEQLQMVGRDRKKGSVCIIVTLIYQNNDLNEILTEVEIETAW